MMVDFRGFSFWIILAGGWSVLQMSPSNEDASVAQWYGLGTLNPRTCSFSSMATGQAKNRHVDLFSTSFLHSCHNLPILRFLWLKKLHQNLPQSKDVESLLRTEIHAGSTNFSWQFLRDCFVHVWCTPQQNSQCCFWASVSFLLYTSSWQEPFGESLSRLTIDSKSMSEFTLLN